MIFANSRTKALFCLHALQDHKVMDPIGLEVKELSSVTDYYIICSGNSDRQVKAIANHIEEKLKKNGIFPLGTEGKSEGRWILLDYGDVVIHIFYQPMREFYDLERLWAEAPRLPSAPAGKHRLKLH